MSTLVILDSTFNNSPILVLEKLVYVDSDAYVLLRDEDADELPVSDEIKADILRAIHGGYPSLEDKQISTLSDTLDDEALDYLSDFCFEYIHYAFTKRKDKDDDTVQHVKLIIKELGFDDKAWFWSYHFGYDDDMRQVVLDKNNFRTAYHWCCHVKNEEAMKDIILKSNNLPYIAYYSVLIEGKDKYIEDMVLHSGDDELIDYYMERKQSFKA